MNEPPDSEIRKFLGWLITETRYKQIDPSALRDIFAEIAGIGAAIESLRLAARYRRHLPKRVAAALAREAIATLADLDPRIRRFEECASAAGLDASTIAALMTAKVTLARCFFRTRPKSKSSSSSTDRVRRHRDRKRRGVRCATLELTPDRLQELQRQGVIPIQTDTWQSALTRARV